MQDFQHGPFRYQADDAGATGNRHRVQWSVSYAGMILEQRSVSADFEREDIVDIFKGTIERFITHARGQFQPVTITLERWNTRNQPIARVPVLHVPAGMNIAVPNRHSEYWVRLAGTHRCAPMSPENFLSFVREATPAPHAWITQFLRADLLTCDAQAWRAPTAWEVLHVIGKGSWTATSTAQAANMLGLAVRTVSNYVTSGDRFQTIQFSAWHTLLHLLGVKYMNSSPVHDDEPEAILQRCRSEVALEI
ncbi:hypothetical protein [Paraburkholderia bannensis]|uniref:hypothetical protein n=1 Tax=Paraburkholderia bannensis TaxID=765414 RepID=UPI002ABD3772|nr:hypothetical protein [Paraburkholderia bannensis]